MGGVNMAKIKVKDNEEMDQALRRFKYPIFGVMNIMKNRA